MRISGKNEFTAAVIIDRRRKIDKWHSAPDQPAYRRLKSGLKINFDYRCRFPSLGREQLQDPVQDRLANIQAPFHQEDSRHYPTTALVA